LAYVEGEPSRQARRDYISERLRLLYVGITRAKRELIVTWNTGKYEADPKQPALAFTVLRTYWEEHLCPAPPVAEGEEAAGDVA
jgi:DNA helicase-2/ATP-dependent DNA helicase PcrA